MKILFFSGTTPSSISLNEKYINPKISLFCPLFSYAIKSNTKNVHIYVDASSNQSQVDEKKKERKHEHRIRIFIPVSKAIGLIIIAINTGGPEYPEHKIIFKL